MQFQTTNNYIAVIVHSSETQINLSTCFQQAMLSRESIRACHVKIILSYLKLSFTVFPTSHCGHHNVTDFERFHNLFKYSDQCSILMTNFTLKCTLKVFFSSIQRTSKILCNYVNANWEDTACRFVWK